MKQSLLKKICIISGILVILLAGVAAVSAGAAIRNDTGVCIIGGADGPTATLLIATHPVYPWMLLALIVFAGTGLTLLIRKCHKK